MKTTPRSSYAAVAALLLTGLLAGCGRDRTRANSAPLPDLAQSTASSGTKVVAVANLTPTEGNQVRGTVRFVEEAGGVRVIADLTGLTPGEHGFHVHETGDCSAPDAKSAGDHFNPTGHAHAGRDASERHMGDLGNLTADASGRAHLSYLDPKLKLSGEHAIIGRAVIVHAKADDLKTQPAGDAGGRVCCGVIEAGK
jgi:superoxide dismutase, Cu-Zn family